MTTVKFCHKDLSTLKTIPGLLQLTSMYLSLAIKTNLLSQTTIC